MDTIETWIDGIKHHILTRAAGRDIQIKINCPTASCGGISIVIIALFYIISKVGWNTGIVSDRSC